ncbi:protein TPX2-like isoform X2 [Zingiber officinale]|uniref:protein TPX2-like isoform X2 n=1 Tax=Zingiber officinale TaxID=94328 RepID=UPI001C4B0D0B|nr:protein TPX2-like isoform X2 [Zingiber officinale]
MAGGAVEDPQIDETYEFSAPRFFDFINDETEEDMRKAELWFETSLSYAPSPFMPKIREGRSIQIDSLCDFGNVDDEQKVGFQKNKRADISKEDSHQAEPRTEVDKIARSSKYNLESETNVGNTQNQEVEKKINSSELDSEVNLCQNNILTQQGIRSATSDSSSKEEVPSSEGSDVPLDASPVAEAPEVCNSKAHSSEKVAESSIVKNNDSVESCTPRIQKMPVKEVAPGSSKNLTARKIAFFIQQTCASNPKTKPLTHSSKINKVKNSTKFSSGLVANNFLANEVSEENQAVKRQKLDYGKARQIHNVRNRVLHHKSRLNLARSTDIHSSEKGMAPFISTAQMVNQFQSRTRDLGLFQTRSFSQEDTSSVIQRRPKLTLTRPKDPKLETAHRVRAVRIKSSAELEAEMLAKIPKFKARPLNKKILEAPVLPAVPKRIPETPVFQEYNFKTMERANHHAETSSVVSSLDTSVQSQIRPLKITEPRPPHLETSLRARPSKIRSSQEIELEELQKIPKFKARPLNKKILESKGEIGVSCKPKPGRTIHQEFHFATTDRLGPPTVADLFDNLSLHPESYHGKKEVPKITKPNPFHLRTEERGLEKEKHFAGQLFQKDLEEEKNRIPRASTYPYTTDFPVMPPKPEPKQCTKPEIFQLQSLVRHEEQMKKALEEKEKKEKEEAQGRNFKAQAVMKEDPLPVPQRERKVLTEVQQFVMHADHRALQRKAFDKKIKDKELTYKRLREEQESVKMIEEEKATKQMRRTMMPHAKPLPKFSNPFIPQKSMKENTKPKSPGLHVKHRVESRRALQQMR